MKKLLLALLISVFPAVALAASGTIYVQTTGAATNSGTTDNDTAVISGSAGAWTTGTAVITLDTNTDISGVPGCAAGTCDGSQAIYLGNATNSNTQRIFWISSYTGCTGSGSCDITVSQNVSCSSCTGSTWAIGGRYLYPGTNVVPVVVAALRAGDTLQFNDTPASKTSAAFVTANSSGDSTSGRINVIGKSGVRPTLATSGSNVFTITSGSAWRISNLELTSSTTAAVITTNSNVLIENVKISGTGGSATQHGVTIVNGPVTILNSEITGVGGDCINVSSNSSVGFIFGNYLHGCGASGVNAAGTSQTNTISGNVIAANTGRGIYLSGAPSTAGVAKHFIERNTVYGNTDDALEVADADAAVFLFNNILMSTNSAGIATWAAGQAEYNGAHGYNVFYSSSSGTITGLTTNATESTSDPQLTNPGSGNFSIANASPAAGTGFLGAMPIDLGGSTTGYLDMGAVQRAAAGATDTGVRPGIR